jgi:hypothetical protein
MSAECANGTDHIVDAVGSLVVGAPKHGDE